MALYYKDDATFLKYLAMSFVGETRAIELLKVHGHEFEFDGYGAGSAELFKEVSRKKQRTPDLRCRLCGQKLEVRSKSNLRIAMSDSLARPFDRELTGSDWVGFLKVSPRSASPGQSLSETTDYVAGDEIYVLQVSELSAKRPLAIRPPSKSAGKGLESYLEWPTLLAPATGTVTNIQWHPSFIEVETANGMQRWIPPTGSYLYNELRVGHSVNAWSTLLTGVARTLPRTALICRSDLRNQ